MSPRKIYKFRQSDDSYKNLMAWLSAYLKENLIKAFVAVSTLIGSCAIFAFHFHLEYSPSFDLQSLASVIFSATYVGILLSLMCVYILFMPTFYVGLLCKEKITVLSKKELTPFIVKRLLLSAFLFAALLVIVLIAANNMWSPRNVLIFTLGIFVLAALLYVSNVLLILFSKLKRLYATLESKTWYGYATSKLKTWFEALKSKIKPTVLMVKAWFTTVTTTTDEENGADANKNEIKKTVVASKREKLINCLHAFILMVLQFLSVFLFFMVARDAPGNVKDNLTSLELFQNALLGFIFVFGSGVYFLFAWFELHLSKIHRLFSCMLVLIVPIFVSFFAGNSAFFGMRIANATKIGNFYLDEITINKHGCDVLSEKGINLCNTQIGDSYKICDTYMMSRIGAETFLKININSTDKQKNQTTPPKPAENKELSEEKAKEIRDDAEKAYKEEIEENLRDIFLPSSDILGVKISREPAVFSLAAIDKFMLDKRSNCAVPREKKATPTAPPTPTSKIIPLKSSDLFEFDNHVLTPEGINELQKLAQEIDKTKSDITKIVITGFADQIGSAQYNLDLSQLRALTVENFLRDKVSKEIDTHVFSSRGYGSTRPKKSDVDCPTTLSLANRKACLADNRRVDVELVY